MKAWLWFVVVPVVLAAAYSAAPELENRLMGPGEAAVAVAPVNLPSGVEKAKPTAAPADRDIRLAAFGILAPVESKTLTPSRGISDVFSLQSVLVVGGKTSAVIDGNLVRPGDKLGGGYRVARIESNAVWLTGPAVPVVKGQRRRKPPTHVLHFPEYGDEIPMSSEPRVVQQSAAPTGAKASPAELEKTYRQILEMLKL